jgi:putative transposase
MPRRHRLFLPGFPQHVVQRGNNRQVIFRCDDDRVRYLDFLIVASDKHVCPVHCFVLMDNHVHFLMTPEDNESLARTMQSVDMRYAQFYNKKYKRTGGLWEGRYRASLVDTDNYLKSCFRYIELNPVRAKLCVSAAEYRWSSHLSLAYGLPDRLIVPHHVYLDLNLDDANDRRARYRSWFDMPASDAEFDPIRAAMKQGIALRDAIVSGTKG